MNDECLPNVTVFVPTGSRLTDVSCRIIFLPMCLVWALPWQSGDSLSLCPYLSVWSAQMTKTNKKSAVRELKEKLMRHIHSFIKTIMRLLIGALTGNQH